MKKLTIAALAAAVLATNPAWAGGDNGTKTCEELLEQYYKKLGTRDPLPFPAGCED